VRLFSPIKPESGDAMKIICLNAWGGRLQGALLPYIASAAPDVLCLQEVVHTPDAGPDWLTYRDGDHSLTQRAHLFAEVAAALPGHMAIFCPAAQGPLWDGDRPVPSQWGLATFVRLDLPVIAQAQGFVHKAYSPHGFGDHPRSRNAHAIRVYDPAQDRAICIAHMHGLRDPAGKADTPERAAQARAFVGLIARVAEPGDTRIICGDFNVLPDSETLQILTRQGLTDLVTTRGFAGTRTSHYARPGQFADYMLVADPARVIAFDVAMTPEVSDHCPLVLEI
jgi:endonuclease/exonuclease/phosphatase family metal-dependent hydrolase